MNEIGTLDFTATQTLIPLLTRMALNPSLWIGFIGFMGGSVFWLSVISRVPLSLAYPMLGLSYVIVVVESFVFLGEKFNPLLIVGALTVCAGVGIIGIGMNAGSQ